jgi:Polyketide cyclase / dehydrase and lipid transport
MRRRRIDVTASSRAAPSAVFGLLADGASWPRWSPIESFELERPGEPPPEGVGAIRVFRRGRTVGRDQIVEVVPDRRFRYVSISGLPVEDYRAEVNLEPVDDGTTIRWHASFAPKVAWTGWFLQRGLGRFLEQCANGLAEHAASS